MSFVALTGNPSGTGTVTVQAPATNNNRALVLPDTSGPLAVRPTYATVLSPTSGFFVDFTGIPSWATRVTVLLFRVSTNGSADIQLQLGAGSAQTSGYLGGSHNGFAANTSAVASASSGAVMSMQGPTLNRSGKFVAEKVTGNSWVITHIASDAQGASTGGATVTLSGDLDRVRLTTTSPGTDQFDSGSINVSWE